MFLYCWIPIRLEILRVSVFRGGHLSVLKQDCVLEARLIQGWCGALKEEGVGLFGHANLYFAFAPLIQ